jgi:hypothetical protein
MSEGLRRLVSYLSFRTIASTSSLRSERGFRSLRGVRIRSTYIDRGDTAETGRRDLEDDQLLDHALIFRLGPPYPEHGCVGHAVGQPPFQPITEYLAGRAPRISGVPKCLAWGPYRDRREVTLVEELRQISGRSRTSPASEMLARTVHTRRAVRESVDAWIPGGRRPAHISHEARIAGFISAPAGTSLLREAEAEVIRSGESRVSR